MLFIVESLEFNGTTLPAGNAVLTERNGTWVYSLPNNTPFTSIGIIPWSVIETVLGGKIGRVNFARTSTSVTAATLGLGLAGTAIIEREWNPAQQETVVGFPVTSQGYQIQLTTNFAGAHSFVFEVVPLEDPSDGVTPPTPEEAYGLPTPAQRNVAGRVVGPYTSVQTVAAGDFVLYDATGGAFSLLMPVDGQLDGDVIYFKNHAASTNALTVDGNGSSIQDAAGALGATVNYAIAWGWVEWRYVENEGWVMTDIR